MKVCPMKPNKTIGQKLIRHPCLTDTTHAQVQSARTTHLSLGRNQALVQFVRGSCTPQNSLWRARNGRQPSAQSIQGYCAYDSKRFFNASAVSSFLRDKGSPVTSSTQEQDHVRQQLVQGCAAVTAANLTYCARRAQPLHPHQQDFLAWRSQPKTMMGTVWFATVSARTGEYSARSAGQLT